MDNFEALGSQAEDKDAVLCFPTWSSLFKVGEFYEAAKDSLGTHGIPNLAKTLQSRGGVPGTWVEWFSSGVECQLLSSGLQGWRKGKLKIEITLKFYADEPEEAKPVLNGLLEAVESPLDSLRQMNVE